MIKHDFLLNCKLFNYVLTFLKNIIKIFKLKMSYICFGKKSCSDYSWKFSKMSFYPNLSHRIENCIPADTSQKTTK